MIILLDTQPSQVCRPGWAAFSCALDSALGKGIGLATAADLWRDHQVVATHVGMVVHDGDGGLAVAEALGKGMALTPLAEWAAPGDRTRARWFRRPVGLDGLNQGNTAASDYMSLLAQHWAGQVKYDYLALPEFLGLHLLGGENPERLFCSEAVATLLQRAWRLFKPGLPEDFLAKLPHTISPHALDRWPGLWEA